MVKHTYLIRVDLEKPEEQDPNIRKMLRDIRWGISNHGNEFEFSIRLLINGFLESDYANRALTTFMIDLSNESNVLYSIFSQESCSDYIQKFIIDIAYGTYDKEAYPFEAFLRMRPYGLVIRFYLPKTIISEAKYEEFLKMGPDDLLAVLTPEQAVECFLPCLYKELDRHGLLDKQEYRDLWKYQMGLA